MKGTLLCFRRYAEDKRIDVVIWFTIISYDGLAFIVERLFRFSALKSLNFERQTNGDQPYPPYITVTTHTNEEAQMKGPKI